MVTGSERSMKVARVSVGKNWKNPTCILQAGCDILMAFSARRANP